MCTAWRRSAAPAPLRPDRQAAGPGTPIGATRASVRATDRRCASPTTTKGAGFGLRGSAFGVLVPGSLVRGSVVLSSLVLGSLVLGSRFHQILKDGLQVVVWRRDFVDRAVLARRGEFSQARVEHIGPRGL